MNISQLDPTDEMYSLDFADCNIFLLAHSARAPPTLFIHGDGDNHHPHDAVDNDNDGYPAHSHHDKIPPWWEYVINGLGETLSPAYSQGVF